MRQKLRFHLWIDKRLYTDGQKKGCKIICQILHTIQQYVLYAVVFNFVWRLEPCLAKRNFSRSIWAVCTVPKLSVTMNAKWSVLSDIWINIGIFLYDTDMTGINNEWYIVPRPQKFFKHAMNVIHNTIPEIWKCKATLQFCCILNDNGIYILTLNIITSVTCETFYVPGTGSIAYSYFLRLCMLRLLCQIVIISGITMHRTDAANVSTTVGVIWRMWYNRKLAAFVYRRKWKWR